MFNWHTKFLNKNERPLISKSIENFELETGAELVIAVAKVSDPYPAAALRFAIVTGFFLTMLLSLFFEITYDFLWPAIYFLIMLVLIALGNISQIKKRILTNEEIDREVNGKAMETFYELCTTKTNHKASTFMYFSLMERKIRLLVDEDLKEKLNQQILDEIVERLSEHFKNGNFKDGILESIETIKKEVLAMYPEKCSQVSENQINNQIFWIDAY